MILHINSERSEQMARKFGAKNGSGDCPITPLVWRKLEVSPEAARASPPKTAVAIVSLRIAFGVPYSHHAVHHSRTTRWRLCLLARMASFLSFKSSRQRTRLAFGGIRRRPDVQGDPCKPRTMSDKLVAATVFRAELSCHLLRRQRALPALFL
jgi:hypothetical protein